MENKEVITGTAKKRYIQPEPADLRQRLNRIAAHYPALPFIRDADGQLADSVGAAVKAYKCVFGLPVTGVTDSLTWRSIVFVCNVLKKYAEPVKKNEERWSEVPYKVQVYGDKGSEVLRLQHYLNTFIRIFGGRRISPVNANGNFDDMTMDCVTAFQKLKKLPLTGVADKDTWLELIKACDGFRATGNTKKEYPGAPVVKGSRGDSVVFVQNALNAIKSVISGKSDIISDGICGEKTQNEIKEIQTLFGFRPDGVVEEKLWRALSREYSCIGFSADG